MTQPPLSRQLKDLEDELGKQLLIRGVKSHADGRRYKLLRKRAEELVDLMEKDKSGAGFFQRKHQRGNPYWLRGNKATFFLAQAAQFTKTSVDPDYHILQW